MFAVKLCMLNRIILEFNKTHVRANAIAHSE